MNTTEAAATDQVTVSSCFEVRAWPSFRLTRDLDEAGLVQEEAVIIRVSDETFSPTSIGLGVERSHVVALREIQGRQGDTDFASRYLLACEALTTTAEKFAVTVFEWAFRDFGLPAAIRMDNGVPFASGHALQAVGLVAAPGHHA